MKIERRKTKRQAEKTFPRFYSKRGREEENEDKHTQIAE
jgi:hypothetical protein